MTIRKGIVMRKIISFVCALAMMLLAVPALAEDAVPPEVQVFFDALNKEMGTSFEAAYAADAFAYVENMPAGMASFTMSRMQYNSFYYYVLNNNTAVTVCCIDGVPAAYIMDFNVVNFIGADDTTHNLLQALPEAYFQAYPEYKDTFGGFHLMTDQLLETTYNEMSFGSDLLEYEETIVSSHMFNLGYRAALQLFPKATYGGLTFEGEPLTAENNHALSAKLALGMEYNLVKLSLE